MKELQNIIDNLRNNNFHAADASIKVLLNAQPNDYVLLILAIYTKLGLEEFEVAKQLMGQALKVSVKPDDFINMAVQQLEKKQFVIAEYIAASTAMAYPDCYDMLNIWGVILKNLNRYSEALEVLNGAAKLIPEMPMAWINMGNIHVIEKSNEQALLCFTNAALHNPEHAESFRLKALALMRLNRHDEAFEILQRLKINHPKNLMVLMDVAAVYYNKQDYSNALLAIDEAIELAPDHFECMRTKALTLKQLGRAVEVVALYEKMLAISPDSIATLISLGHEYSASFGDSEKAKKCYDLAYSKDPQNIEVLKSLCDFLPKIKNHDGTQAEYLQEAHRLMLQLAEIDDDKMQSASIIQLLSLKLLDYESYEKLGDIEKIIQYWVSNNDSRPLISQMSRVKTIEDRVRLLEAHKSCGANLEANYANKLKRSVRQRLDNKIRIGIMSSDLRNHPVGYFVWPIVEYLDRSKFEIYCYSFFPHEIDHVQKEVMNRVNSFSTYVKENEITIGQAIEGDHLDILFELGGRTVYNKTNVCAYKPAPVQVSWLGYPHSIGFPTAIDYILVDPYINPGSQLLIEKPFMMPKTWVSIDKIGFVDVPIANGIPQDRNGYITFGTLNASHKITLEAIAVWAKIMKAVPNSRFLYVRPEADAPVLRDNFCKYMQTQGIDASRISFAATHTDYLQYYNNIDIALDTFPHTGGTTTCEALWMGVPTVTLVGPAFFERLSYSNLNNAGLGDLCSFNLQQYHEIAIQLVENKALRSYLRHNLRRQIAQNPLGQSEQFAYDFGGKIRDVLGR